MYIVWEICIGLKSGLFVQLPNIKFTINNVRTNVAHTDKIFNPIVLDAEIDCYLKEIRHGKITFAQGHKFYHHRVLPCCRICLTLGLEHSFSCFLLNNGIR